MADTWNLAPADADSTQSFTSSSASQSLIEPQPNVLDKFASYTYQASVYLMTPDQYRNLLDSNNKTIPDSQLLFQSGGKTAGNKFFDNDFYIDNITLETVLAGKQTQAAHMATDIKFTVTEPMGITLLDRLYNAVADSVPTDAGGNVNFTAVQYLMAIRFFGYDQTGKLSAPGIPASSGNTADPKAVIIKYIPFLIKKINWTVGTKLVTYEIEGGPVGQTTGGSTSRGTVPFDIELSAKSVGEILSGTATYTTARDIRDTGFVQAPGEAGRTGSPPPNAGASPTTINKTITSGLMDAMNRFQLDLVKGNIYTIADQYEIEFVDADEIKQAQLTGPQAKQNKQTTAMAPGANISTDSLDSNKIPVNNTQQIKPVTAGQSITQVIDLIIRNSSYITAQELLINEADGATTPGPTTTPQKPMSWFLITYSATPIGDKIDPKRNDFAYKIKYTVTKYSVPNFDSAYFPIATYPGLHKQYNYWFTGQNTAVLDYSANYDSLYNITVNGTKAGDSAYEQRKKLLTSSVRDLPKYTYNPRSSQGVGYGDGKSNESSANAAEYLYSPDSLSSSKLRIVGDPAWIQQGSLFKPISVDTYKAEAKLGFLPDGTISFDSSQVLYEIAWQRPEDYNLKTGLADPYAKTFQRYGERLPLQSNIYQAIKVVSEFRGGQFEQTIEGTLYFYNKPQTSSTTTAAADTGTVDGSDNRFARQETQAQTASQSAAAVGAGGAVGGAGGVGGNSIGTSSFTAAAQSNTGTRLAPLGNFANQAGIRDTQQLSQLAQQVPNIVPSQPPGGATSNGQTIGPVNPNGQSILNSSPPVLIPGAGRTSLDSLQSAALSIPPYLTRRDA
jgi:hypothetical protein